MASKGRLLLFSVVAVAGVLLVVELILVVAGVAPLAEREDPFHGFSKQVRIFEEDTANGIVRTRPRAVRHSFNAQEFPSAKPDNGLRIFVLGGSSAYGFPWGAAQAFPAALERALQDSLPQRDVQAVNAAGMSYGSHRLRILTPEMLDYAPDLLVVYGGHNEFVERDFYDRVAAAEPLPGGLRLWLHRWRLYSAMQRLLAPPKRILQPSDAAWEAYKATLIGLDADREYATDVAQADRDAVRAQFEDNLRAIAAAAKKAAVPVLFCTVPSNMREWRPNQTTWPGTLSAADRATAVRAIERATEANDAGDAQAALEAIAAVEAISPAAAGAWFQKGRALLALGRTQQAADAFAAARDLDGQPGRAIGAFNDTIRTVARDTGSMLVDVERTFRETAEDGIPGFEFFEDYVHPKPAAHLLIAREVWRAVLESGRFGTAATDEAVFLAALGLEPGFDYASTDRAPDAEDSAHSASLLFNLGVVLENQERYEEAMERYRSCLARNPAYIVARVNLARLLRLTGRPKEAAEEYAQVLAVWPDHLNSAIGLGESLRELSLLPQAEAAFRLATEIDADSPAAWNGLGAVLRLAGNHREAELAFLRTLELDPDNLPVRSNLGMAIFFQGRLDEAETEFRAMLELRPDDPGAMNGMGAISVERNELDAALDWFSRVLAVEPDNPLARDGLAEVEHRRRRPSNVNGAEAAKDVEMEETQSEPRGEP